MAEVNDFGLLEAYSSFVSTLPSWAQNFVTLFLLVLLIVIYAIFIWKFYRFISTKNIVKLNLKRFNKVEHPFFSKLIEGSLSFVEYIVILPFLIFFWFSFFTVFLILLTDQLPIESILLVSVTIIAAIRMTSYIPRYGQDLAREIAKLLPFTLLAVSIINPNFFSIERIISHLGELVGSINLIFTYLLFIIVLEIILRLFEFIFSLMGLEDDPKSSDKDEEEE